MPAFVLLRFTGVNLAMFSRCPTRGYLVDRRMKKLVAPGVVVIPSSVPSTRQGPDSRGIRICVAQLGRSCALQQGFIIFTDGSAYSYDPQSNTEFELLCASVQRGKVFNFAVRRPTSGYVRGFTPPADYEIIYTFPPYPGTAPASCPLSFINWNDMIWDPPAVDPGVPPRTMTASSVGNTFVFFCDGRPSDPHVTDFPNASIGGGFNYTGAGGVCNFHFEIDQGPSVADFFINGFTQDGNPIDLVFPNPSVTGDYAFDVDAGISSVIRFDGFFQGVTGQGPTNCTGVFTPAN